MERSNDWARGLHARDLAIFLDVDGTLLGFRDRPGDVVADGALRDLLAALRDAAGGALALVSGRTVADLDRIMAPLVLAAGGTHGAEMRWPDGRATVASADALALIRPHVQRFVEEREGLALEDKGAALAVHYRQAPHYEDEATAFLAGMIEGRDLMVQHGKMVADVKSASSSKGRAIEAFMAATPFAGRRPLFIGDDLTDEHGFGSVEKLKGVSIKVGTGDTIAQHRLASIEDVRVVLSQMLSGA